MASDESLGAVATRWETEGYRANVLGMTKEAVSQWIKRGREEGAQGLRWRIAKGATPHLCASDRGKLPELQALGTETCGFEGDVWTSRRVAQVIKRWFGVSFSSRSLWPSPP